MTGAIGACTAEKRDAGGKPGAQGVESVQGVQRLEGATGPERGRVVATVGSHAITADDLQAEYEALEPAVQLRFSSPERKKALLEQLVQRELLAQEALRQELHRDPQVAARFKRAMANAMLATLRQELVKLESVTEPEIQREYRKHRAEFPGDFEQERERVQNRLFERRRQQALQDYVAALRARADVRIHEKRLGQLPEKPSSEGAGRGAGDAAANEAPSAPKTADEAR